MINYLKTLFNKMVIKFHKGSTHGTTANTGSSRIAVKYIDHEDEDRLKQGKEPFKYITSTGEQLSSEEAVKYIDEHSKGLCKEDYKFYLAEVCPSKEEIQQMGQSEKEVYETALGYMAMILDEYAVHFHREGLKDRSNLVVVWKPHYTRGKNNEDQFHIHLIIGHKTQGMPGKQIKISPISNHRDTTEGPIKGGFDRKAFIVKCEKLFDALTGYERKVAETFDYVNTMKRGSIEQKAEQAEKLVNETAQKLEADIKAGIERRRKNLQDKADIEEIAKALEKEGGMIMVPKKNTLSQAIEFADLKNKILEVFNNANNSRDLYYGLTALGITIKMNKSEDGIEDLIFEKLGRGVESKDIMSEEEHHVLLSHFQRLTGKELAEKVRERRAKAEAEKQIKQRPHGGPKFKR